MERSPVSALEQDYLRWSETAGNDDVFTFLSRHAAAGPDEQIEILLRDQSRGWSAGRGRFVEEYLEKSPQLRSRSDLRLRLIREELRIRQIRGEPISAAEYLRRFPDVEAEQLTPGDIPDVSPDFLTATRLLPAPEESDSSSARNLLASTVVPTAGKTPSEPQGVPEAELPAQLGRYTLLEEIARGGMGIVYRAKDGQLDRVVALKLIRSGLFAEREELDRFQVEARAAAQLDHPGIVPVYEFGREGWQYFLAMAYVDGQSLAARTRESLPAPRDAARWLQQVAEAVHYAHERGIIHRDLKPQNILLSKDGRPKVTDFGLAKRQEQDASLTRTGQILGTPGFMPPEQARGETQRVGPAADIYSLGATLYAVLTGRPPFQSATHHETMRQVIEQEPLPPRRLRPDIPRDLETICLKCLEKDPVRRYASAQELAADLRRFLDIEPIVARRVRPWRNIWRWSRKRPVLLLVAALVLAEGAGAAMWYFYGRAADVPNPSVPADLKTEPAAEPKITPPTDSTTPPARDLISTGLARHLFDGQSLTGWRPMSGSMAIENVPAIGPVVSLQDAIGTCVLVDRDDDPLRNFRLSLTFYPHQAEIISVSFGQTSGADVPRSNFDLVLGREEGAHLNHRYAEGRHNRRKKDWPLAWSPDAPHEVVIERQHDWWFVTVDDLEPVAVPVGKPEPLRSITLNTRGPGPAWLSKMEIVDLVPRN